MVKSHEVAAGRAGAALRQPEGPTPGRKGGGAQNPQYTDHRTAVLYGRMCALAQLCNKGQLHRPCLAKSYAQTYSYGDIVIISSALAQVMQS